MNEFWVSLHKSHCFWYDLVVNRDGVADYFDAKKEIVTKLKEIEKSDNKFVYFICSRPKIRFDTKKKISYCFLSKNKIKVPILINGNSSYIYVSFSQIKQRDLNFDFNDKFIHIIDNFGNKLSYHIHNFVELCDIRFDFAFNVEYVGYTGSPKDRPTNGSHSGLSKVLHNLISDNDIFIIFNTFNFINCFGGVNIEEKIIEKSFIKYFSPKNQNDNREREDSSLKNFLTNQLRVKGFDSVVFTYWLDAENEYSIFGSCVVNPKYKHRFRVYIEENDLKLDENFQNKLFDIMDSISENMSNPINTNEYWVVTRKNKK